uniref:Uncharacterized protein LOC105040876 isoform X2 n=1 Tax=Elaeis guineensis var. tenera TaxID=51953 RepID=A0A8N4EUB1_ELAGV|nr:uncharacterized protein LOC105040876 isoform X2 [Elaeis guineensis]
MVYGPWIRAARVPVDPAAPGSGSSPSMSSSVAPTDNSWITPKKVASKPSSKPNKEILTPYVGGSRFSSLSLEEDSTFSAVMPMEVLHSEGDAFTHGVASTSKEKRKQSPTQSAPPTRASSSNKDAQTACGGCSSVCLPRPTIYICSSMKIIMWNCQGAAKPSFPHPRAGSREKAIVALMASLIWYARNQRIFQGHFIPPAHLLRLCVYFHKNQFFSSTSFPPGEPTQSRIWGNPQLFLQFYSMNFISWTPPPLGVLTINFDGAVTAERAAGSFIIRNHEGAMLAIGGNLLPAVAVPFAELIEVWLGVKYLFTHLYSQCVWIQGDSSIVITWLKNLQRNRMSLSPWMQDIKI